MKLIMSLISESEGQLSTTRVMALAALVAAIVLAFNHGDFNTITAFIVSAFGGKAVQKHFETRGDSNGDSDNEMPPSESPSEGK